MKWLVDTHIHIPRNEVDRDLLKRLKRELTFDNPEYLTRVRMGKSTWKVPDKIEAYKITGDELIIPRGCNRIVKEIFGAVEYDDRRSSGVPLPVIPKLPLRLRDYQDEAVQQMKRKHQGVVIIPCGGGKTAVALDAIRQAQTTTIVMVHTLPFNCQFHPPGSLLPQTNRVSLGGKPYRLIRAQKMGGIFGDDSHLLGIFLR